MNKFEQVSSDDHQMSLAGAGRFLSSEVPCLEERAGALYSKVQCIMGNGHMGSPMDRMMDRHD